MFRMSLWLYIQLGHWCFIEQCSFVCLVRSPWFLNDHPHFGNTQWKVFDVLLNEFVVGLQRQSHLHRHTQIWEGYACIYAIPVNLGCWRHGCKYHSKGYHVTAGGVPLMCELSTISPQILYLYFLIFLAFLRENDLVWNVPLGLTSVESPLFSGSSFCSLSFVSVGASGSVPFPHLLGLVHFFTGGSWVAGIPVLVLWECILEGVGPSVEGFSLGDFSLANLFW